jgi:hypothetical protein
MGCGVRERNEHPLEGKKPGMKALRKRSLARFVKDQNALFYKAGM